MVASVMMSIFKWDKTSSQPNCPDHDLFMAAFHIGTIWVLFFFTWKAPALAMVRTRMLRFEKMTVNAQEVAAQHEPRSSPSLCIARP